MNALKGYEPKELSPLEDTLPVDTNDMLAELKKEQAELDRLTSLTEDQKNRIIAEETNHRLKEHQENIDKQQREYFLQQQIKTIQKELGGSAQEQDVNQLKQKAAQKKWSDAVKAQVEKEITKLEAMPAHSPDFSVQMNYVQTLVNLPWNEYTKDNFNLKTAERVLNKDHLTMSKNASWNIWLYWNCAAI